MTILNVDDSVTMRKIISIALKGKGYEVVEAENGRLALDMLPTTKPAAVILDINMPVMGGIEFLKELSKSPSYRSLPVIVLTTQGEDELRKEAMNLGAKAFLVKPFQKETLLETLQKVL